ncbi:unnamed protein product [Bemisia tabaci]|uniref:Uncharacterized protein n=1 Tax=Bemisia tabaci TaxID=7038 RepID=A0A9P0A0P9_BEMTA|nr:unnamed protein product [Bemisia tabaci]
MPVDLYFFPSSAPCRAVSLAAKLIGVDLNIKNINLNTRDHLTPEFLKMNPQHTVPTINDNGFFLFESRAIIMYLFNKYGKDDSLYPKDAQKRAIVDQMLCFDMGTLFQRFAAYYRPVIYEGVPFDPEKLKKVEEAIEFFEKMLEVRGGPFAAGSTITLADAALIASISSIDAIGAVDLSKYQNVNNWFSRCKSAIPDYEGTNGGGIAAFRQRVRRGASK